MKSDIVYRTLRITEITIRNFRSIRNLTLAVDGCTIISGLNDVGKSNILKALNLFFNGETDYGCSYNFEDDYCLNAPVQKKKAKIIEISIKFLIPENFKDKGEVVWTKRWGRQGIIGEEGVKDREFSPRSKAGMLFNRIKYRYVPAVKSEAYFKSLLRDLYASIAKEVDSGLAKKTKEYSEHIKQYTNRISRQLHDQFGVRSALEYPKDQSAIFKELQFVTDIQHGRRVALVHRGDGIQAVHIPAILRFIAEKDNEGLASNSILCSTFWGYEEPENGLEMMRCYDVAHKMYEASSQIQMFITSHSPAFFSLGDSKGARSYWASKETDTGFTMLVEGADGCRELGYMPLIAPYLAEKAKTLEEKDAEISRLKQSIEKSPIIPGCTIMVEGITDKEYLSKAFLIHSSKLHELVSKGKIRIFYSKENGGTKNLGNYVKAWHLSKVDGRLLVLVDNDRAGRDAENQIKDLRNPRIKSVQIPKAPWIERIYDKIVAQECFSAPIETLFSAEVWSALDARNMLIERSTEELQKCFGHLIGRTKTLDAVIQETISGSDIIFVNKSPHPDKKTRIAKHVCGLANNNPSVFDNFRELVGKMEAALSK